jgi:hypothetical protein
MTANQEQDAELGLSQLQGRLIEDLVRDLGVWW